MTKKININGIEVQLFEKMYDYVRNADFSNYPDEEVDALAFPEDSAEKPRRASGSNPRYN